MGRKSNKQLSAEKLAKDQEVIARAMKNREKAYNYERLSREEMVEDMRFCALDQWDSEVEQERRDEPMLVMDRINAKVSSVVDNMRESMSDIEAFGVEKDDREMAQFYEDMVRHIEYHSKADYVYEDAGTDCVRCGFGVFRVVNEYATHDSFDQVIKLKNVENPLNWWFDPAASDITKFDGNFVIGMEQMDKNAFEEKYKMEVPSNFAQQFVGEDSFYWTTTDYVTVAEYYEKVPDTYTIIEMSTGHVVKLDELTDFDRNFMQQNNISIVRRREVKGYKIHYYKLTSFAVIEHEELPNRYFPVIPVYGEIVNVEGRPYIRGVVRGAKDPQRMINYNSSAEAEQVSNQNKIPYIGTYKMFAKYQHMWESANRENYPYLPYDVDPDAPGLRPERQPPPAPSQAYNLGIDKAAEALNYSMGMHGASDGIGFSGESGDARRLLQSSSEQSTSIYSRRLNIAREHAWRVMIDMIPHYYDTARVVRLRSVKGEDRQEVVNFKVMSPTGQRIINNLSVGEYDVRFKAGGNYRTKRQETVENLLQLGQIAPEIRQLPGYREALFDNLDIDGADNFEPKPDPQQLQQQQQMQAQQQAREQRLQQLNDAEMMAEIEKTRAETQETKSKTVERLADVEKQQMERATAMIQYLQGQPAALMAGQNPRQRTLQ